MIKRKNSTRKNINKKLLTPDVNKDKEEVMSVPESASGTEASPDIIEANAEAMSATGKPSMPEQAAETEASSDITEANAETMSPTGKPSMPEQAVETEASPDIIEANAEAMSATGKPSMPEQAAETEASSGITEAESETVPSLEKALKSAPIVEQPPIEELKSLDLTGFKSPKVTANQQKTRGGAGAISIVATEKSGKRITLSHKINRHLDHPGSVQIALSDDKMIIAETLNSIMGKYHLKASGNKAVIYSTPLVEECIERYNLDYTNKTTITFYEAEYGISTSGPFVSIKMK
ncbi:hypothetical protein [Sporosarcina sp. FSL K6-5500]|uniref:hypothetical protein n=1 Tax=Sporosarcina sp. FSL K6-5500 TaxID=2921558 RepID=UPI0030FCC0F7